MSNQKIHFLYNAMMMIICSLVKIITTQNFFMRPNLRLSCDFHYTSLHITPLIFRRQPQTHVSSYTHTHVSSYTCMYHHTHVSSYTCMYTCIIHMYHHTHVCTHACIIIHTNTCIIIQTHILTITYTTTHNNTLL